MIYTLTLNPALDITITTRAIKKGSINKTKLRSISAGGKGFNTSRGLNCLKIRHIMIGSSLISIIALIFTIFINNTLINIIAIGFVELGFSGFAPLILSTTSTVYGSNKDVIVTIIFFFGLSGNALAPYFTKLISGNNMVFSLALTIFLMTAVLVFTFIRVFYKKNYM